MTRKDDKLDRLLRGSFSTIEPSKDFERVFWQKILERQKEPWFVRVLKDLESLIPSPTPSQAVAFLLVAFLVGGMGGAAFNLSTEAFPGGGKTASPYLSGFHEVKGIPASSLAATYLKSMEK